jgi:hypothetical protein
LPLEGKRITNSNNVETKMLSEIQRKVITSKALNGGFDVLMYKVDKIEETQGKIVETVSSIHNAIYHPDDGLFARINSVKSSQVEDKNNIEKQLIEINSWKAKEESSSSEAKNSGKEIAKKVTEQDNTISNLENWKKNVNAVGKWTIAAIAGGAITLLFKLLGENLF